MSVVVLAEILECTLLALVHSINDIYIYFFPFDASLCFVFLIASTLLQI